MTSSISPKKDSSKERLRTLSQDTAYESPWPLRTLLRITAWNLTYLLMFRWTPKPLFKWRSFLLRMFGAKITGTAFVASSVRIKMPWNLEMVDRSCIGSDAVIYNLATVRLGHRSTVAQEAYLCTGTHDFARPNLPLVVGPIEIGDDCFVGARAFLSPGIKIGNGAIVGACSVVTRDVPDWEISAGNPSKRIADRPKMTA